MYSAPYCAVLTRVVVSSDFRKVLCESRYDICGQTYDGANRRVSLFGYFLLTLYAQPLLGRRLCCRFFSHSTHTSNSRGFQPSVVILAFFELPLYPFISKVPPPPPPPANVVFKFHHGLVRCV